MNSLNYLIYRDISYTSVIHIDKFLSRVLFFLSLFSLSFSLKPLGPRGPSARPPMGSYTFSLYILSLLSSCSLKDLSFSCHDQFTFLREQSSSGLVLTAYSALAMFLSLSSVLAEKSFSVPSRGDHCSCNTLSYVIVKQASAPVEP